MPTCNQLDLQILGSQPVMQKIKSPRSMIPTKARGEPVVTSGQD